MNQRPLGDMPPEEFRRVARETADWIADFLAHAGDRPVFPAVSAGSTIDALPARCP